MSRPSLQRDFNRWLLIAATLCAVVGGVMSAATAYFNAEELQDSMLQEIARWVPSGATKGPIWSRRRDDEQVLVQTLGMQGYLQLPSTMQPGFHNVRVDDDTWRVLVARPAGGGDPIAVAQQTELRAELAGRSATLALLPVLLLALGFVLVTRWVLERNLRPMRQLASELDAREALSLEPLDDRQIAKEIQPFTHAINRLLRRTREDLARQQRFIADAAHELRTPVAGLNLLAENAHDNEQQRALMRRGLHRLETLVSQLLDLARLQAEHQPQRRIVDCDDALRELVVAMHPLAADKNIDLGVLRIEAIRVEDYDHALSKLFRNGLSNAVRYTPDQGRVDVSLFADQGHMVFRVQDSGPGIDPGVLEAVFEPFNRGTQVGNEGNGLGLSIAAHVAERLGGQLRLTNPASGGLCYEYRQRLAANT